MEMLLLIHQQSARTLLRQRQNCVMCREGFNAVFPLEHLKCLYEDEIETMLCGMREQWTVDMLADTIKFDHG